MKYVILTSSLFYLLGLKFTSKVDLNPKVEVDTLKIRMEAIKDVMENRQEISIKDASSKNDSIMSSSANTETASPKVKSEVLQN